MLEFLLDKDGKVSGKRVFAAIGILFALIFGGYGAIVQNPDMQDFAKWVLMSASGMFASTSLERKN